MYFIIVDKAEIRVTVGLFWLEYRIHDRVPSGKLGSDNGSNYDYKKDFKVL